MKKWAIALVWWYVVAPGTTIQHSDGRRVYWPPVLEGPYIEETDCKERAAVVSERRSVAARCEESEVLRELRP